MKISSTARQAVIAILAMTIISFIFLALKLATRFRVPGNLGHDDFLVTLSFIFTIPLAVAIYLEAKNGMGHYSKYVPPANLVEQMKWFWVSVWIYVAALGLSKLSILCQYLRIFIGRRTTIATWLTIAFVTAYTIQGVFLGIFQCTPVQSSWDKGVKGRCIDSPAYYYFAVATNIFTDLTIIVLPIPALSQLHIPTTQKIGVVFVFVLGGFGCIISIIRLRVLVDAVNSTDWWHANVSPAMWSAIEVHICLICACLTSLRPALSHVVLYIKGLSSSGKRAEPGHKAGGKPWQEDFPMDRLAWDRERDKSSRDLEGEPGEPGRNADGNGKINAMCTSEVYSVRVESGQLSRSSEGSDINFAHVPTGRNWYHAEVSAN